MGLTIVCDKGEITVRYNGKVLQKYFLERWLDIMQGHAQSSGVDYIESYIMRQIGIKDQPPTCIVDHSEAILADNAATGKEVSWKDIQSIMLVDLPCKSFNIEMQVDPKFIHCVWFGWNGFTNTSAAQLSADLETAQTVFKQQPEYQLIETRCKDLKAAGFPITNIVILGNGSYYGLAGGPVGQLAAIMEIRTLLGSGGTSRRPGLRALAGTVTPLPCVFQDPQTCEFENQFLRSLGHTTVDDPDAFDLINANSLVIYIHNPGMESYIMKGVWPAAILAWKSARKPMSLPDDVDATELDQEDLELEHFEEAYKVLPFMESKTEDGVPKDRQKMHKYNFHLRKDLNGAADFSFSV